MYRTLAEAPGWIALLVKGAPEPHVAAAALREASDAIARLDGGGDEREPVGPSYISEVVETPIGPFLILDCGDTDETILRAIPGVISEALERAGQHGCALTIASGGPLDRLPYLEPAVVFRAYPMVKHGQAPAPIPEDWLVRAGAWFEGRAACSDVWIQVDATVQFPASPTLAREIILAAGNSPARSTIAVAGDVDSAIDGVGVHGRHACTLTLASGGPNARSSDVPAVVEDFREFALALSPRPTFAMIDVGGSMRNFCSGGYTTAWSDGPARPRGMLGSLYACLTELAVFEVFAWQLLNPSLVMRLHEIPPGARMLDGHLELALPELWQFHSTDDDQRLRASLRPLLAGVIFSELDLGELLEESRRIVRAREGWPPLI